MGSAYLRSHIFCAPEFALVCMCARECLERLYEQASFDPTGGRQAGQIGPREPYFKPCAAFFSGWEKCLQSGQADGALWRPRICHCHSYNEFLFIVIGTSVPHIEDLSPKHIGGLVEGGNEPVK